MNSPRVETATADPVSIEWIASGEAAVAAMETLFAKARAHVAGLVTVDGRVSGRAVEEHQYTAHGLAWAATYVESLRQMTLWATRLTDAGQFGEAETLIYRVAMGEYLAQMLSGIPDEPGRDDPPCRSRPLRPLTPSPPHAPAAVETLITHGNTDAARLRIAEPCCRKRKAAPPSAKPGSTKNMP